MICGCVSTPTVNSDPDLRKIGKILKVEEISKEPQQTLITTEYAYITIPFPANKITVGTWGKLEKDDYDGTLFLSCGGMMQYMVTEIKFKEIQNEIK